jgi:hypothetical protein
VNVQAQIDRYIDAQDPPKRDDIEAIQRLILAASPNCKLWFLDGRDSDNKIVTNENIGYGTQTLKYAGGGTREFYRIGLSSNATGISLYLMGIEDRKYLPETYGGKIGNRHIGRDDRDPHDPGRGRGRLAGLHSARSPQSASRLSGPRSTGAPILDARNGSEASRAKS